MRRLTYYLFVCISALLVYSCVQPKYGIHAYDQQTQSTNYYLVSYGGMTIPGFWFKGMYDKESGVQYFVSADTSRTLAIALIKQKKLANGIDADKTPFQFVKNYPLFQKDTTNAVSTFNTDIIYSDSLNNYVIRKGILKHAAKSAEVLYLIGKKKKNGLSIALITPIKDSVPQRKIWNMDIKIDLIQNIYLNN
ncbi:MULTISPECIES: hypothetical protein [Chitinophagaceae]